MKIPYWTIYCHIHTDSGRRYIGLTKKTMMARWNNHVRNANQKQGKGCLHFWAAIRKYGKEAFSHEVLEACKSLEEANLAEIRWIDYFDTRNSEKGFNLAPGGKHTPHSINNEYRKNLAFRAKISANAKKLWQDPVYRSKVLSATQAAIRTDEVRQKLSDSVKELWQDPKHRENSISKLREVTSTPEHKEKLRSKWNDQDFREKCSVGTKKHNEEEASKTHCRYGHKYTEESTVIGKNGGRECKICNYARKKAAKTHCPKGHIYSPENTRLGTRGRRICIICLEVSKTIKPCSLCGKPKTMRIGDRMRCKPCTNGRIKSWRKIS